MSRKKKKGSDAAKIIKAIAELLIGIGALIAAIDALLRR